jgi:hypothetical protein
MRKKLIWSVLIITTFWLFFQVSPAFANCPSGVCAVEINCTTGVVTYTDAPPKIDTPSPFILQPVAPTHTINVQTSNGSWATSGTSEQIAQAVQTLAPQPLTADPCLNGGCNKIEINATTGVTTISPLTETDLKQRAKDQVNQNQRQAELAKTAYQALPNITAWQPYDLFNNEPIPATLLDETITPEWWADWQSTFDLFFKNWFWWWTL